MAPLSILIVGCGIAGPTFASLLLSGQQPAKEKPNITIVERSSLLRSNGQNVDIRGEGVSVMKYLGLEKVVRTSTTNEAGVHFVDRDNIIWAEGAADRTGKVQTGTSDIEVLRGRLAMICYERCQSLSQEVQRDGGYGVEFIFGDTIQHIKQSGAHATVFFEKSRDVRTFNLVVGADGLQSQTRKLAWGADREDEYVKRLGVYGGFFSMPAGATDSLWRRWFLAPGRRSVMVRPSDTSSRSTVLMMVMNEEDARLPEAALKGRAGLDEQKRLIERHFRDAGWECERLIRAMHNTDDFYFDMLAQVKLDSWSRGRVVLLGDAGCCSSPLSGMGTTLSFTGSYHLAGAILHHQNDLHTAFKMYEEAMRPIVVRAQRLAPGMSNVMFPETQWGADIMRWIFYLISTSGIMTLLAKFAGPPTSVDMPMADYGFIQHEEMAVSSVAVRSETVL